MVPTEDARITRRSSLVTPAPDWLVLAIVAIFSSQSRNFEQCHIRDHPALRRWSYRLKQHYKEAGPAGSRQGGNRPVATEEGERQTPGPPRHGYEAGGMRVEEQPCRQLEGKEPGDQPEKGRHSKRGKGRNPNRQHTNKDAEQDVKGDKRHTHAVERDHGASPGKVRPGKSLPVGGCNPFAGAKPA